MQEQLEKEPIFGPVRYIRGMQKVAANDEIRRQKAKPGKLAKVTLTVQEQKPVVIQKLLVLLETLEEVEKLEQFKHLLNYKKQENEEFVKYLERELPNLSNEMLVHVIDFTNSEVEKLWYLRAL